MLELITIAALLTNAPALPPVDGNVRVHSNPFSPLAFSVTEPPRDASLTHERLHGLGKRSYGQGHIRASREGGSRMVADASRIFRLADDGEIELVATYREELLEGLVDVQPRDYSRFVSETDDQLRDRAMKLWSTGSPLLESARLSEYPWEHMAILALGNTPVLVPPKSFRLAGKGRVDTRAESFVALSGAEVLVLDSMEGKYQSGLDGGVLVHALGQVPRLGVYRFGGGAAFFEPRGSCPLFWSFDRLVAGGVFVACTPEDVSGGALGVITEAGVHEPGPSMVRGDVLLPRDTSDKLWIGCPGTVLLARIDDERTISLRLVDATSGSSAEVRCEISVPVSEYRDVRLLENIASACEWNQQLPIAAALYDAGASLLLSTSGSSRLRYKASVVLDVASGTVRADNATLRHVVDPRRSTVTVPMPRVVYEGLPFTPLLASKSAPAYLVVDRVHELRHVVLEDSEAWTQRTGMSAEASWHWLGNTPLGSWFGAEERSGSDGEEQSCFVFVEHDFVQERLPDLL